MQAEEGVEEGVEEAPDPSGSERPAPAACCCRRITRRRRIVYATLCGVLVLLIGLMTAITAMQVMYLTHEEQSSMDMNSTSPGNDSMSARPTLPPSRVTSPGGGGGTGGGGTAPMASTPLNDPTREHTPVFQDEISDTAGVPPSQPPEPGKKFRGRGSRVNPYVGPAAHLPGGGPISPTLGSPIPHEEPDTSTKPMTVIPGRSGTPRKRDRPPGRPADPPWIVPPRRPPNMRPKHRHKRPYPKRRTSKSHLKDTFLWLILSLFTVGVLLVVVTVVVVRYLNARKRQQHSPLCACFPCCVGPTQEPSGSGPEHDIPLRTISAGQSQSLSVIVEEPPCDLVHDPTGGNACDDQGSHTSTPPRERTYSADTVSTGTNVSEPPAYNIAVELPAHGGPAPSGPNQPPSYDDAISAGAGLQT